MSQVKARSTCRGYLLFHCVSFPTDWLVHPAHPAVAQPLEFRADARNVPGVHIWGDSPFRQGKEGEVQQEAALLELISWSLA